MTGLLAVLAVVLAPAILGLGITGALAPGLRRTPLAWAGWAYPMGALGVAALTGLWILSGLGPARWIGMLLPVALGALLLALGGRSSAARATPPSAAATTFSRLERVAWWAGLGLVLVVLVDRIAVFDLIPVMRADEAWIWTLRAKFLWGEWVSGSPLPASILDLRWLHHPDYPLFNPLLNVWTFVVAGAVTDVLNRVPFQLVFLSAVLLSAAKLRAILRPTAALALMILWIPSNMTEPVALWAHADFLVASGFLLALEAWHALAESRSRSDWRLFACALALLVWSKHEGAILAACIASGCALHAWRDPVVRRSLRDFGWALAWLALPLAVFAATWLVNARAGVGNEQLTATTGQPDFLHRFVAQFSDRAWPALRYFGRNVFLSADASRLLWIPFFLGIVAVPRMAFGRPLIHATLAILASVVAYWVVFVGSVYDLEWQLGCAADRVLFHLWPALLLWTARLASEAFPRLRARPLA